MLQVFLGMFLIVYIVQEPHTAPVVLVLAVPRGEVPHRGLDRKGMAEQRFIRIVRLEERDGLVACLHGAQDTLPGYSRSSTTRMPGTIAVPGSGLWRCT